MYLVCKVLLLFLTSLKFEMTGAMKSLKSFVFVFVLFPSVLFSQTDTVSRKVTIVFAGDIMGHGPQFRAAYDSITGKYDYEPCFRFIKPYINSADISIANLEVTFGGLPYSGYPTFSSPNDLARHIQLAGFKILVMANNHCYDRGKRGFEKTIKLLDSLTIPHLGTYKNIEERNKNYPFIIEVKGIRIALLNYTYGTNGIVADWPSVINYIDKSVILSDLKKADSLKADYKIAIMHWGQEYQQKPNKEQKDLARFMAKNGCNAIIGSHPHVVQTFETIYTDSEDSTKVVPVFYSMGNLMSNQRDRYRDGGAMFSLTIEKDSICKTIDYNYLPYWVYRGTLNGKYQYYIIPPSLYTSQPDSFKIPLEDSKRLIEFEGDTRSQFPNLKEGSFNE